MPFDFPSEQAFSFAGIPKVLRLPPQCTFWRFLASLHLGIAQQLLRVQRHMRERVWQSANIGLTAVTLDTDTTVHTLFGHQMGGRKGYHPKNKGKKSYQPILTVLAETRELCNLRSASEATPGRPNLAHSAVWYFGQRCMSFWNKLLGIKGPRGQSASLHDAAEKGDVKTVKRLLAYGADVDARTTWTDPYAHNADDRPFGECPPDHGFTPLHFAAGSGYIEVMKLLVAKKAKVDARSYHGHTPLHWAAENGREEVAEFLLTKGADVNANGSGETPLYIAAQRGHRQVAEFLLTKGADVNARDSDGRTLLHLAARGDKQVVDFLLSHRAEIKTKDKDGATPLHTAVSAYHNKDIVQLLLIHGAKVNTKDNSGRTPLHVAVLSDYEGAVAQLLLANKAEVNARDSNGRTPLHVAADGGYTTVAESLLANKAEVNAKDKDGATPLHMAANANRKNLVELLLAKGADVNARDSRGATPLSGAVERNHENVAELLRQAGGRNFFGEIHDGAKQGDLGKVKAVLKDNRDLVNAKDSSGRTPLHAAAAWGREDVAQLLVRNGADVNARDNYGHSPLEIALNSLNSGSHKALVDLLLANKAKIEMLLHKQAEEPYLRRESVELLLSRGTDINAKDYKGRTPLHVTAEQYFEGTYYHRDHKTAQLLVERGANVDAKDNDGRTPLHVAVQHGNTLVAQMLVNKKANVDARDNDGRTPLHIAAAMGQKSAVLILLLGKDKLNAKGFIDFSAPRENGATINVVDINGKTPLQCAMARGHKEIVELLRHHGGP
jgi:ankyrin repeat protein